ncbi:MAG: inositol monophosphatase [Alphaproteobacteria bacterium]
MYAKELNLALAAAKEAGAMAMSYQGRPVQTELKGGLRSNPVTEADKAIDRFLYGCIKRAFPHDGWLSEEDVTDNDTIAQGRCWVVDPIDGTQGFLRWLETGEPHDNAQHNRWQFSISIALVEKGVPVVGVVYAPLKGQMVSAIRGQGVTFNGHAVKRATPPPALAQATYLSSVSEERDGLLDFLKGKLTMHAYGSVAYKLALTSLTANCVMASVKPKNIWDVAAGELLCTEAGLLVTDLAGQPFDYSTGTLAFEGLIAAPAHLHAQLRTILPSKPTGGYR